MHPDSGVGGGPYRIEKEWRGEAARDIISVLKVSASYPGRDRYRSWPGPNSNTYAAWVVRRAGVCVDMHPKAIGKDYLGWFGVRVTATKSGVQAETPVFGLKVGVKDGVEFHFLGLTLGVDIWPPAFKTPLGRLGFRESSFSAE
jgi:hypothetical protein